MPALPTSLQCLAKIQFTAADDVTAAVVAEVGPILAATLADFQSPVGPRQSGGTGRSFEQVEETRYFDGKGDPELVVHDIVPGSDIECAVYDIPLTDVVLKQAAPGQPSNILFRRQWNGTALSILGDAGILAVPGVGVGTPFPPRVFPYGLQNIAVTTTWGAVVTTDIYEAIRCEVCYQLLVGGVIGINGVGEEIELDGFQLNTSVGAINFALTSPVTVYHKKYEDCKKTYRLRKLKRFVRNAHRMV